METYKEESLVSIGIFIGFEGDIFWQVLRLFKHFNYKVQMSILLFVAIKIHNNNNSNGKYNNFISTMPHLHENVPLLRSQAPADTL